MLTIYEELLLLSIHEAKGTFIHSVADRVTLGIGGAVLAELALMGNIKLSKNHRLKLIDDSKTDIDVLDEAIAALKESGKDRKFGYWINTFTKRAEKFRQKIIESLIQKGVFTQDDENIFWAIPSPLQPDLNASTKYLVNKRLRGIVLAQEELQSRDITLLTLIKACGLLNLVFLRDERKLANRNIYELEINHALKNPVILTIQEIEIAIDAIADDD